MSVIMFRFQTLLYLFPPISVYRYGELFLVLNLGLEFTALVPL
jgi:hypothetical protein